MMRIEEALVGTVLLDDEDKKLLVKAASDERAELMARDKQGRLYLIDYHDVQHDSYLAFVDEAAADAYIAEQKAEEEKAAAA